MLYVSEYDKDKCLYGVKDTDDNSVEFVSGKELRAVIRQGIRVEGVMFYQNKMKVFIMPKGL